MPEGSRTSRSTRTLTAELLRRGYKDEDVRKVIGGNLLRVMREAERVSKKLQAERGPSTMLFEGK